MDPRLRRLLGPPSRVRDEIEPPPGLAARTLGRVAEYCSRMRQRVSPRPRVGPCPDHGGASLPGWPRADVFAAAVLLLFAVGVLLPAIGAARHSERVARSEADFRSLQCGSGLDSPPARETPTLSEAEWLSPHESMPATRVHFLRPTGPDAATTKTGIWGVAPGYPNCPIRTGR